MEMIAVGLIGLAAAGYIVWNSIKSVRGGSSCSSGGCAGCAGCGGGCGKVIPPEKRKVIGDGKQDL